MSDGGWSIDIENAWLALFKVLGKAKLLNDWDKIKKTIELIIQSDLFPIVQMMTVAYSENEIFGDFPTKRQSSLLLDSWSVIENELDEVGIETFTKLFESHSDIQSYFPSMKKLSTTDREMTRYWLAFPVKWSLIPLLGRSENILEELWLY